MGGYFGGGGEGLGGGGEGEGGGGLGGGGGCLVVFCCAAQLHPKRQMIANRNVNIWDTIDVDLLAVKTRRQTRFPVTGYKVTGKFGFAESGKMRF